MILLHFGPFQTSDHSTETAVTCILNDMIGVLDQGQVGALMLLDLSAAFHTVDHDILRRRFESTVQHSIGCPISLAAEAKSSVSPPVNPMPPLCILVYRRVPSLAQNGSLNMPRMSASFLTGCGTTCLPMICKASSTAVQTMSQKLSALEDCATDVSAWYAAKRLQLNAEKTEVL